MIGCERWACGKRGAGGRVIKQPADIARRVNGAYVFALLLTRGNCWRVLRNQSTAKMVINSYRSIIISLACGETCCRK